MWLTTRKLLRTTLFNVNRYRYISEGTVANDLVISDSCIKRLQQIATDGSMLRISVDGGGCSGFRYKFELDTTIANDDKLFEQQGVKVVVDSISLSYIKGSTVDYEEQLIKSGFRVLNNPIADDGCSCGSSFSVKI